MSFQNANLLIQKFIDNYGNTGRTYEVFPFVQRVSAANNKVILDPNTFLFEPGKLRQVRINYWPILCDVEGDCNTQTLCSSGTAVQPKQQMFDITRCTASRVFAINKNDIRLIDNNRWDFSGTAIQIIASAMPEFRRALAIDMTTRLYELAGVHPDGNPQKRISLTSSTNGIVNPIGRRQIEREYNDAGFMPPYFYGGAEVDNWKAMVNIGGLNAQGQQINMLQAGMDMAYYDSGLSELILNDEINGGHILTMSPEVFKYVFYLENAGIFQTAYRNITDLGRIYTDGRDGFIEGSLFDPVTGFVYDLFVNYDKCTHQWTFWFKHNWDFFVMPDIACNGQGVNGIMHWRTCPEKLEACPTGVTPSPAVTPSTFSWTPGDIFPVLIHTSNIGGVENQPDTNVTTLAQLAALMNDNYTGGDTLFTVNGSDIEYTGFTALSVDFNNGDITGTFA